MSERTSKNLMNALLASHDLARSIAQHGADRIDKLERDLSVEREANALLRREMAENAALLDEIRAREAVSAPDNRPIIPTVSLVAGVSP